MRRREPTLDPAVAAELEALEAALAGDPAAEPELAALVRDVRAAGSGDGARLPGAAGRAGRGGFERALRPQARSLVRPTSSRRSAWPAASSPRSWRSPVRRRR